MSGTTDFELMLAAIIMVVIIIIINFQTLQSLQGKESFPGEDLELVNPCGFFVPACAV